jgi:pyruvate kinase
MKPAFTATKIVCTLGPSSSEPSQIKALILAGMNVARLNFAHGTVQDHADRFRTVRAISRQTGIPVGILQDLPGPKLRVGPLNRPIVRLRPGTKFRLTTRKVVGGREQASVSHQALVKAVKRGDLIYLADGSIKLEVANVSADDVSCRVLVGGDLSSGKGINVPGIDLGLPALSGKDVENLRAGVHLGVDFVGVSFVQRPEDVRRAKQLVRRYGSRTSVLAKIEKPRAVERIEEIVASADGVIIARGDLGVELPVEQVPVVQKKIIALCNRSGKPVVTATQMLQSMLSTPRPTRAEVSDIANAIYDGTDAVMLSEETAIGRYPIEAVRVMKRVAASTEMDLRHREGRYQHTQAVPTSVPDVISYSACETAVHVGAKSIVAQTRSGLTAQRVSRYRPLLPILGLTPYEHVKRRLCLFWGVCPVKVSSRMNWAQLHDTARKATVSNGFAQKGDYVVLVAGDPTSPAGTTNLLTVTTI